MNLLHVSVPPTEAQILLKVRFADVDRSATQDLGLNLFSTGATNTIGRVTTGHVQPACSPGPESGSAHDGHSAATCSTFSCSGPISIWARPSRRCEAKSLLQILAEPNVLAINGKTASFLAGGEFPYPTLQGGGGGLGAVTIQFREFGVRINFTPDDYAARNHPPAGDAGSQLARFCQRPGVSRASTFRLLPRAACRPKSSWKTARASPSAACWTIAPRKRLSKVPGLANIPLLGKLFQSRSISKNNSELLVLVTPELVRPIPKGQTGA